MKIYNTLSKKVERFISIDKMRVKMYSCGVTPYDEIHLGHARQAIVFDVLRNYLEYLGYKVTYVRNFTDIDDKIIRRSQEKGTTSKELSEHYIAESRKDLRRLKIKRATHEPKVTKHIPEIISFIHKLLKKGYAYERNGEVLFRVDAFKAYGKLSNRKLDKLISTETSINKDKIYDFSLWKPAKAGEPSWKSPWGPGRPGWHIECSVLSKLYMGTTLDIHGGGLDLVFPHHENEIAQSESYSGKPLAHYWMHNGLVMVEGKKMSKSLGNFYTVKDLLKQYTSEEIRFAILVSKYSSEINFSHDLLLAVRKHIYYFYKTLNKIYQSYQTNLTNIDKTTLPKDVAEMTIDFRAAMDDDLNTPLVIAQLSTIFKTLNTILSSNIIDNKSKSIIFSAFIGNLKDINLVLKILDESPKKYLADIFNRVIGNKQLTIEEIENQCRIASQARRKKDYQTVDKIRSKLAKFNICLQDQVDNKVEWDIVFT